MALILDGNFFYSTETLLGIFYCHFCSLARSAGAVNAIFGLLNMYGNMVGDHTSHFKTLTPRHFLMKAFQKLIFWSHLS